MLPDQVVNQETPGQVFIVGMNGSGTTMLLEHLANHSMLYGFPAETQSLPYFMERESEFGDLGDDAKFLKMWNTMLEWIARSTLGKHTTIPLPDDWRDVPRSVVGVFSKIMSHFANRQGKQIWCEKTPMHVHHLALLGKAFPTARFIHIIRDGRDCAASFHRRWDFSPIRTAYRWKLAVRAGRSEAHHLGNRYLEVRYEDVTNSPRAALERICEHLRVPFEESVLVAARARPEMSGSSAKTIAPNARGATGYFGEYTICRIEQVAGRCLAELGYPCRNETGDADPPAIALRWWQLCDDTRRAWGIMVSGGRILRPASWPYILGRAQRAFRQKLSLKS